MRGWSIVIGALMVGVVSASCGGGRKGAASAADPGQASVSAGGSATPAPVAPAASKRNVASEALGDVDRPSGWAWSAIGCWVGGPWTEALGALGEERNMQVARRCRAVVVGALRGKPDDEAALEAMRSIDPSAVERVVQVLEMKAGGDAPRLVSLVRATADAAREAMAARRAGEVLRKDFAAKETTKHEDDLRSQAATLSAGIALAKLWSLDLGKRSDEARVVALVVAADHVESARGLDPRAKILAATPAFGVVFGVKAIPGGVDAKPGDWLAFVTAAAAAAAHPAAPPAGASNVSNHDREQLAFAGVVAGFADRFEAISAKLPLGEALEVAEGYARRLRAELAESGKKAKDKAEAKKTTSEAEKKGEKGGKGGK